jgi:hypothetical protein
LLIVLACAGMWWPLVAVGVLFLVCWALATLLWRMVFGSRKSRTPEPTLEQLCAQERRIQEHAAGYTFRPQGMRADNRARLAPR